MDAKRLQRLRTELTQFVDRLLPDNLSNRTRHPWAERHLRGLLLDGSVRAFSPWPNASRRSTKPTRATSRPCSNWSMTPVGGPPRPRLSCPAGGRHRRLRHPRRHRFFQARQALSPRGPAVHRHPGQGAWGDHYKGRRWHGWHHHVTLVLLTYALLVLRRRIR